MQACVEVQDFAELKSHAHRLRGSALVLGFDGLAEHFYSLERLCTFVSEAETNNLEVGTIRKVQAERDYAVYVLGKIENTSTLRIITPTRKFAAEKIIDDSIGRCIRQINDDFYLTYVKKMPDGNYLKIYDI